MTIDFGEFSEPTVNAPEPEPVQYPTPAPGSGGGGGLLLDEPVQYPTPAPGSGGGGGLLLEPAEKYPTPAPGSGGGGGLLLEPATRSTTTSTSTSSSLLRIGSSGNAVKELQLALASLGYDVGPIDGIFGPKTDAAVRAFQADAGITVDGLVGPITQAALGDAQAGTAPAGETTTDGRTSDGSSTGSPSGGPNRQRLGVLQGGSTVRIETEDGLVRYYQIYEFPPGSGQYISYRFNDEAQAITALGRGFEFTNRTESWLNDNVLAFAEAEEIIGRTESFNRLTTEIMLEAAAEAGVNDPTLAGMMVSNPEMQNIMVQAIIGDWSSAQVLAAQRNTDFWKNVLYPGIERFYSRTTDPERAWIDYVNSVSPALRALGYTADADGTFNSQIKRMLDLNIDQQTFLSEVPIFIQAEQNAEFATVLNAWAERDLGREIGFNDWFDLLAGEALPEIEQIAENARLAYLSGQAGTGLSDSAIEGLAGRTNLSDSEASRVFSDFNRAILAVGDTGLQRYDLSRDEVLSAMAGVNPQSGRSVDEVKLKVAKLARENDLFDEEKIKFYVGFTPFGTPTRPGLTVLAPEGA